MANREGIPMEKMPVLVPQALFSILLNRGYS